MSVSGECKQCRGGKFKAEAGVKQCDSCTAGFYSSPGATSCRMCPAFSFSEAESSSCTCFLGYTGPDNGPCMMCPAATYKDVNGSQACTPCPSGAWSLPSSTNASACIQQSVNCSDCPQGSFQTSACTASADRKCAPCAEPCRLGYWEMTPCTAFSNRKCAKCTRCEGAEFRVQRCTPTSDAVCQQCNSSSSLQFLVPGHACTWSKDALIAECTDAVCPARQYRRGCGYGQMGQCVKCEACSDGEYRKTLAEHGVGCGGLDPGVCEQCPAGTYSIGDAWNCTACRPPCSDVGSVDSTQDSLPSCSVDECEATASELGVPFSIQSSSNGAPAGCIQYTDGRVIFVETCLGDVNCGTSSCNGCSVLECNSSCSSSTYGCCVDGTTPKDDSSGTNCPPLVCSVCEYESVPCTVKSDRVCSPCSSLPDCGEGYYRKGCSGVNPGVCSLCQPCQRGFQRHNCTGLNPGVCAPCPAGYYNSEALLEQRPPVTFTQWRIRAATTNSGAAWQINELAFLDTSGGSLIADRGNPIFSSLLSETRPESSVQRFESGFTRLGRQPQGASAGSFFLGWDFKRPTAVSVVRLSQPQPSTGPSNGDWAEHIVVEGRNRADFTQRLDGLCVDRAGAITQPILKKRILLRVFTGPDVARSPSLSNVSIAEEESICLHLCETDDSVGNITACELAYSDMSTVCSGNACCFAHTSDAITQAGNTQLGSCWLATPASWKGVMEVEQVVPDVMINISRHTQQKGCHSCSRCDGPQEYIAQTCSSTSDVVCGRCSALTCNSSGSAITAIGDEWRTGCGLGSPGTCVTCGTCPAAQIRWNCWDQDEGTCLGCLPGFFSEGDSPTCDPCTVCTETQFIQESCRGTADRVCKECSERQVELDCGQGTEFRGCGGGGRRKGYCARCKLCPPGSFRVQNPDPANGCGNCSRCQHGKYAVGSPTETKCTACTVCQPGYKEARACTAKQDRICVPVVCTACPVGQYTQGCLDPNACATQDCMANQTDTGSCVNCEPCAPGEMRVGCGGVEAGRCVLCQTGSYSVNGTGCLPCSTEECPSGQFESSDCSATGDRVCSLCAAEARRCAEGQYLQDCGEAYGSLTQISPGSGHLQNQTRRSGQCVECAACPPGLRRDGCGGTAAGECVACPNGTYVSSNNTCANCSSGCGEGSYQSKPCSDTSDIECVACEDLAKQKCGSGTYLICERDSYECKRCSACNEGFFIKTNCSATNNTECQPCAPCNTTETPGYTLVSPCTGRSHSPDSVCRAPLTTSTMIAGSTTSTTSPTHPQTTPVKTIVRVSLVLPMSVADFDDVTTRAALVQAIAAAAGVDPTDVSIAGVSGQERRRAGLAARRLFAQGVKVDLEIATSGPAVAPSLDAINAELGKKGLPQATLYQPAAPTTTSAPAVTTTPPPADGWPWWAIVTAAAGGAIVLVTALALVMLHGFRRRARQRLHEAAAAACVEKQAQAQVAPLPCCQTAAPILNHSPH